jgi:ATP-dependent DNA helicase RecG
MPDSAAITLTTNVAALEGVGPRRAAEFRRLGIRCVADLLVHLPMRYERDLGEGSIGAAASDGSTGAARATIRGEVLRTRVAGGRTRRFEATVADASGTILLTWFNAPWMKERLHPGMRVRATGRMDRFAGWLQMVNPAWEALGGEDEPAPRGAGLRPVYSASEELTSAVVERTIAPILEPALALVADHLGEAHRRERAMPELAEAYRMIHRPRDEDEVAAARRRLAYDELLMLQLAVMMKRRHRRSALAAPRLRHDAEIDRHILARIPFALTPGQRGVIDEIARDLQGTVPMNRLVQGDVGAGKTVVALYAILMAVASECQAALMAPTELLAEQHEASIVAMLEGARVRIALLTGSLPASERARVLAGIEAGEVDVVIGTHALLTQAVAFRRLAVAIVDEQHRFGVHQRALLRAKAGDERSAPHTLVMTATPIPRTLALTLFGDLDVSTIHGLPPGRRPLETRVLPAARAGEAYAHLAARVARGEQGYVVVPAVEESDAGLVAVDTHLAALAAGPLAGRRLAGVHGRLARAEREDVMGRFRAGAIDVLVATTVIEVGVDVPNATMIVIEHADRFGLAQLHQLRGRVGRGQRPGLCVLVADPAGEEAQARIEAFATARDGFEIAERDLEIRGPGEILGAKQAGLPPFRAADLRRDASLLAIARRDAEHWIDESPTLERSEESLLRSRLLKAYGAVLGLADVG